MSPSSKRTGTPTCCFSHTLQRAGAQVYKGVLFSLGPTRTPNPANISSRCANLATDDDMTSTMYAVMCSIKRATDCLKVADKTSRLPRRQYKKDYHRQVCLACIFRVGDYIFLDSAPSSVRWREDPTV